MKDFLIQKKKIINNLFGCVVGIFFLAMFVPNFFSSTSIFNAGTFNTLYRGFFAFVLLAYGIVCMISNEIKINKYIIFTCIIIYASLIICTINNYFLPTHYYFIDSYYRMNDLTITLGLIDCVSYLGNSLLYLVTFLCLFTIFPKVVGESKTAWIPFLVEIILTLIAIIFSFITEFKKYILFFSFKLDSYANGIESFFSSKNTFGIFLFQCFVFSFAFVTFLKKKIFLIPMILSGFVLICTLNKSNILALIIFLISFTFYIFKNFEKHKIRNTILISTIIVLALSFFILVFAFKDTEGSIFNKIYSVLFAEGEGSLSHRLELLHAYFNNFEGQTIFFGYGPSFGYRVKVWCQTEKYFFFVNSLHNTFFNILARDGILYFCFYIGIQVYVFNKIIKYQKKSFLSFCFLIGLFVGFFVFSLLETAPIFVSSSANTFLTSLIIVCFEPLFGRHVYETLQ